MGWAAVLFFLAAIISWLLTYPLVFALKWLKANQTIRAEGPASHQAKAGTPTMAGLGFILATIILSIIFINYEFDWRYLALILLTMAFALIGLLDDLLIIIRKQNLGLTFWQKLISQIVAAAVFVFFLPGTHQSQILYFLFAVFVVVGGANAANLTDGLNGLLAGTGGIAFLAMALLGLKIGQADAATFALIAAGSIFAFLYYNFPKAQVFMGDVGSLAIGAALAGLALIMQAEIRLSVIGGIFVIETLSVIIQVTIYKLFKRRVFKMSPLHHHFELLGFKEKEIVLGFWVVAVFLGLVGVFL
ncbi:phospho-N-acetylmuramoyl-pentapeptide-transferase [Candidatus Saganbacteria bacterium]|nr:phospho-N-acetylmuramoyl-pentapeptide-transferase [Candidatus Saganbacteria bacterium]